MYLRSLKVEHLKLFELFSLAFDIPKKASPSGAPLLRKWTAIIGENGTGKSALLQAIALAAVGMRQVNRLGEGVSPYLRDRRADRDLTVDASFLHFAGKGVTVDRSLFGMGSPTSGFGVQSTVTQAVGESDLSAVSRFVGLRGQTHPDKLPLDAIRARNLAGWFVAAYGIARTLPFATDTPRLDQPGVDRLRSLFDPRVAITSTGFATLFRDSPDKLERFERALHAALFSSEHLLPGVSSLTIRGEGGSATPGGPSERNRFTHGPAGAQIDLPLNSLSHGYQSTVAWIADLIGHYTLESTEDFTPDKMRGLVLIDELDLYLHPSWQVVLVRALKRAFPRMQFVFTTHSPLVLAALDPAEDQVVQLTRNAETGSVEHSVRTEDARLLTASELLKSYFELDDLHPDPVGRMVYDYRYLAANPYRRDEDDAQLAEWRAALKKVGVDPHFEPVPRRAFRRGPA